MKTKLLIPSTTSPSRGNCARYRNGWSHLHAVLVGLLLATLLATPVARCRAGTGFPGAPTDETSFSIGVFQVIVDPNFAFLFAPVSPNVLYYPGYAGPASGILTGPLMFDGNTVIGESAAQVVGSEVFAAAVGAPVLYPGPGYRNIQGYGDYAYIPPQFTPLTVVPAGVDEVFTQIKEMNLQGFIAPTNDPNCADPRVPSQPSNGGIHAAGIPVAVKAGPGPFGIGSSLPLNRRSIGMVQQLVNGSPDDLPAQSFFNIYIELDLPGMTGTASFNDFPVLSGVPTAILYNDVNNPLLIENFNLTNLPPTATYVHNQTTAVPIRFRDANPPYWAADDVLGYLTLAGHGVTTNGTTGRLPCTDALGAGGLLDQVLGPIGSPILPPPIPWLRNLLVFPCTNAVYKSFANSFVDPLSGLTNILDDTITFVVGGTTYYLQDLVFTNRGPSSVINGGVGSSLTYTKPQFLFFQISTNGINYLPQLPASGLSGSAQLTITNVGVVGSVTNFNVEILQQLFAGANPFGGGFRIRESTTLPTFGHYTVQPDPHGYRIATYFDENFEISVDSGTTWQPGNKTMRLLEGIPAPTPGTMFVRQNGTNIVIAWQNSFTVQTAPTVTGPWTDLTGSIPGPFTNLISGTQQFYRLRQ